MEVDESAAQERRLGDHHDHQAGRQVIEPVTKQLAQQALGAVALHRPAQPLGSDDTPPRGGLPPDVGSGRIGASRQDHEPGRADAKLRPVLDLEELGALSNPDPTRKREAAPWRLPRALRLGGARGRSGYVL